MQYPGAVSLLKLLRGFSTAGEQRCGRHLGHVSPLRLGTERFFSFVRSVPRTASGVSPAGLTTNYDTMKLSCDQPIHTRKGKWKKLVATGPAKVRPP